MFQKYRFFRHDFFKKILKFDLKDVLNRLFCVKKLVLFQILFFIIINNTIY